MTPASFLQHFPEFEQVSPTLIAAALARAASRMGGPDALIWGAQASPLSPPTVANMTQSDMAQGNLAAHYLISSPFGASTLLVADKKSGESSSIYLETFRELETAVAGGFAVAGVVV